MRILAIDTSSTVGSVAVVRGARAISISLHSLPGHSESLLVTIRSLLDEAGLGPSDPDLLAAGTGPGSFTGLRVGLAAMKGLHMATGKPLLGAPSLLALAMNRTQSARFVCAAIDARRGDVFSAVFSFDGGKVREIMPEAMTRPEKLLPDMEAIGERVLCLGDAFISRSKGGAPLIEKAGFMDVPAGRGLHFPSAVNIAAIAAKRLASGETDDPAALEPRYVRPVDFRKG
jgi:tRNA threonylcarbamoyladenosine biosynthesis protein TsaB